MPHFETHFTLEEARAWLPELRKRFEKAQQLYAEVSALRVDHERVMQLIQANGHAPKLGPFEQRLAALRDVLKEVVQAGIEIKDVSTGLVDFPHFKDGEEVFLCWKLGEDDISYWHTIEDGFAGREPL